MGGTEARMPPGPGPTGRTLGPSYRRKFVNSLVHSSFFYVVIGRGFLAFISYSIGVERLYLVGQGLEGCRRVLTVRFHH